MDGQPLLDEEKQPIEIDAYHKSQRYGETNRSSPRLLPASTS